MKDNRVIKEGVWVGGTLYAKDGDEDALAAALTQDQLDRLVESGALVGDWKAIKKPAEKPEKAEVKK